MADSLNSEVLPETQTPPDLDEAERYLDRAENFLRVCLLATGRPVTPEALDWQALHPVITETINAIFEAKCSLGLEEWPEE